MPSVKSVLKDIEALGAAGQEIIYNYLEEAFVLGSFASQVTSEVKENRTEKDTIKSKNLLVQSHTSHTDTKLKDFEIREAIYIEYVVNI
jgi:hypothetical protein